MIHPTQYINLLNINSILIFTSRSFSPFGENYYYSENCSPSPTPVHHSNADQYGRNDKVEYEVYPDMLDDNVSEFN